MGGSRRDQGGSACASLRSHVERQRASGRAHERCERCPWRSAGARTWRGPRLELASSRHAPRPSARWPQQPFCARQIGAGGEGPLHMQNSGEPELPCQNPFMCAPSSWKAHMGAYADPCQVLLASLVLLRLSLRPALRAQRVRRQHLAGDTKHVDPRPTQTSRHRAAEVPGANQNSRGRG